MGSFFFAIFTHALIDTLTLALKKKGEKAMYNIDQEVYVKGTIVAVSKEDDGSFEYRIKIESPRWSHGETVTVTDRQIKQATITMDELERVCR